MAVIDNAVVNGVVGITNNFAELKTNSGNKNFKESYKLTSDYSYVLAFGGFGDGTSNANCVFSYSGKGKIIFNKTLTHVHGTDAGAGGVILVSDCKTGDTINISARWTGKYGVYGSK